MSDGAELVRRFWTDVWGNGDLDALGEIVTDPYVRHLRTGRVQQTRAAFADDLVQLRRVLTGLSVEFHAQTVDGDTVWTRLSTSGIDSETGSPHRLCWMQQHRVEDGRLAESWSVYDPELRW